MRVLALVNDGFGGFSIVLLEAMACGLSAVGLDMDGSAEKGPV